MSDFGGRWSHLKPNHKYHAYLNEIEGLRRKHNHNLLLYGMSKRLRGAWTRHHMALLIKAGHCTTPEMASVIGLTRRAITKEVREHPYFFQRLTRGRVMLQNIEPPRPLLPFVFVSLLQPTFTELNPANVQTVLDQSDPPDIQDQVYVQNLGNECTAHNMVQDLCMVTPELLSEKCRTGRSLDPGGSPRITGSGAPLLKAQTRGEQMNRPVPASQTTKSPKVKKLLAKYREGMKQEKQVPVPPVPLVLPEDWTGMPKSSEQEEHILKQRPEGFFCVLGHWLCTSRHDIPRQGSSK